MCQTNSFGNDNAAMIFLKEIYNFVQILLFAPRPASFNPMTDIEFARETLKTCLEMIGSYECWKHFSLTRASSSLQHLWLLKAEKGTLHYIDFFSYLNAHPSSCRSLMCLALYAFPSKLGINFRTSLREKVKLMQESLKLEPQCQTL